MVIFLGDGKHGIVFSPHTTRFAGMNLELGRPSHGKQAPLTLSTHQMQPHRGDTEDVCEGIGFRVDWNFNLEIRLRMVKIC